MITETTRIITDDLVCVPGLILLLLNLSLGTLI